MPVSIPKELFKVLKERYIMKNYDRTKYSLNKLALECNYTQRHIYKILNKNLNKCKRTNGLIITGKTFLIFWKNFNSELEKIYWQSYSNE